MFPEWDKLILFNLMCSKNTTKQFRRGSRWTARKITYFAIIGKWHNNGLILLRWFWRTSRSAHVSNIFQRYASCKQNSWGSAESYNMLTHILQCQKTALPHKFCRVFCCASATCNLQLADIKIFIYIWKNLY